MFHYKSCGLENIYLRNGFVEKETPYGKAVSIHDLAGLHRAIGMHIVKQNPGTLSKQEIVFLRKELDLPQRHIAALLDINESTYRNWESGRSKISGPADRLLRTLYIDSVCGNGQTRQLLERISELNRDVYQAARLEMEEEGGGWMASTA